MNARPLLVPVIGLLIGCGGGDSTAPPPPDTTSPSVPMGLAATQIPGAYVHLTWEPSTDNVGVVRYETSPIDVNGGWVIPAISSTATECVDSLAIAWEPTRYVVGAYDAAGNRKFSANYEFTVIPTAADVAGTWRLSGCDPGFPDWLYDNVCAEDMTFRLNPDSIVTGTMTNLLLVVPKDAATYGKLVIASASFSGRFTGHNLHLEVLPDGGPDWSLLGGTIDLTFLARPPAGWAWRLRHLRGDYSITGSAYSYDFQWHSAYNSGTISFVR